MGYKIDKDVPIPALNQRVSRRREILREMSVGDSVQVQVRGSVELERNSWSNSARSEGYKLTTRSLIVDGKQYLRIWRTS